LASNEIIFLSHLIYKRGARGTWSLSSIVSTLAITHGDYGTLLNEWPETRQTKT